MKKSTLYALWGGLFILCAGLGFIPFPAPSVKILSRILALFCFLPPAWLLYLGNKSQDRALVKLIRNLSALSLLLTLVLLVIIIVSAAGPILLGNILNSILIIVSSPMMACGNWALSMFLWACLLMVSLQILRKIGKSR